METEWLLDATLALVIMIKIIIPLMAFLFWAYTKISKEVITSGTAVENTVGGSSLGLTQNEVEEETQPYIDNSLNNMELIGLAPQGSTNV